MSQVKRAWEAEQELGYSSCGNKTVCSACFEESGIQSYIEENASDTSCSYCNSSGDHIVACQVDDVIEYILKSLRFEWGDPSDEGLPYESREGGWQYSEVLDSWDLLDECNVGARHEELLNDIRHSISDLQWCKKNPYSLTEDRVLLYGWEGFSKFVMNEARYVFFKASNPNYDSEQYDEMNPIDILDSLGVMVRSLNLVTEIPTSTELVRVRIVDCAEILTSAKELGAPAREFAKMPNRMSPAGISMFYGAFDLETAISETYSPKEGETKKAVCGYFKPKRDLKVIDLSKALYMPSLFDEYERDNRVYIPFVRDFMDDFTKPIDREDRAHIDYVPTQIVTEYFKFIFKYENELSVDGIIYPSSKSKGKKAIVLFANSENCVDKSELENKNALLVLDNVEDIELK
ncbi:HEPN-associated N-terminal domain-containing protein [Vibrio furnissii]|uniref:HEPN-associated N-terminal domain-containing protein n=1 Tax=Vibrio furnissii TaxID=29494 RepID=UPI0013021CD9|nr:HEPN-associated N-terminal domain-containing protein [Vibrio furnissii]